MLSKGSTWPPNGVVTDSDGIAVWGSPPDPVKQAIPVEPYMPKHTGPLMQ
jgi:hypothetical protein